MRAISYARTSTTGQKFNTSSESQHETNRHYIKSQGWTLAKEVTDNVSGRTYDREGVRTCLEMLESGKANVVVAYDVSRSGRQDNVIVSFINDVFELGGLFAISSSAVVYEDAETALFQSYWQRAVANYEVLQTDKRTNRGKIKHLENDSWMWKTIYGYKLVKKDKNGIRVNLPEIVPEEAVLICGVFDRLLAGESQLAVTRWLNTHRPSTTTAIRTFLKHRKEYAGVPFQKSYTVNKKKYNKVVSYPPIISPERAVELDGLIDNKKRRNKQLPFAGNVQCSCGEKAVVHTTTKGISYFICLSLNRERVNKNQGREYVETECRQSISHNRLIEATKHYISEYAIVDYAKLQLQYMSVEVEVDKLDKDIKGLNEEKNKLIAAFITNPGGELAEAINERIAAVNSTIEEKDKESSSLKLELTSRKFRIDKLKGLNLLKATEGLRLALEHEDWTALRQQLDDTGLTLTVDFSNEKAAPGFTINPFWLTS